MSRRATRRAVPPEQAGTRPAGRLPAVVPRAVLLRAVLVRAALLHALVPLALVPLPGCLFTTGRAEVGARWPADVEHRLVRGTTTKAEVLALLGPPTEFKQQELDALLNDDRLRVSGALAVARRGEDVLTWQRDVLDAVGTWLVLYNHAWVDVDSDLLVVFFDEHDVVSAVAERRAEDA